MIIQMMKKEELKTMENEMAPMQFETEEDEVQEEPRSAPVKIKEEEFEVSSMASHTMFAEADRGLLEFTEEEKNLFY